MLRALYSERSSSSIVFVFSIRVVVMYLVVMYRRVSQRDAAWRYGEWVKSVRKNPPSGVSSHVTGHVTGPPHKELIKGFFGAPGA